MGRTVWDLVFSLYSWVKKEKYHGWDPYDWLYSPLAEKIKSKYINFVFLQANLYSPLNLRPEFGIKKGMSNKALALFSQAYLNLYHTTELPEFKAEAKYLLSLLDDQKIKRDIGIGWASHYFGFFGPKHMLNPSVPDIVGTCEAIKAFSMGYQVFRRNKYKKNVSMAIEYLIKEHLTNSGKMTYFKYTPTEKEKVVFNVSALALEAIAYYLRVINYDTKLVKTGEETLRFLLQYQGKRGEWPYAYFPNSNNFYYQLDYHQGFIIDGVLEFIPFLQDKKLKNNALNAISKGINFYMDTQFSAQGWSYYRYPIKYPIDVHNQAQGIITFSRLYKAFGDPKYLNFAKRIAEWTVRNMQDSRGYFYAHKWPGFVNKIPYMRWAQAWMMLALSTLMFTEGSNNESSHGWTN